MFEGKIHEVIEKDLKELEGEIERVKESEPKDVMEKKEVVKKSFQAVSLKPQQKSDGQGEPEESVLPDYVEEGDTDVNTKMIIEKLIDMVFHKGLIKTLKASKKYPPFIQDAFHDALTDKLLPELEKRGMLN